MRAARQVLDRAIVTEKERPAEHQVAVSDRGRFPGGEVTAGGSCRTHYVTIDGQRMSIASRLQLRAGRMTVLRQPRWNTCGDARCRRLQGAACRDTTSSACAAAGVVPPPEEVLRVAMAMHEQSGKADEASKSRIPSSAATSGVVRAAWPGQRQGALFQPPLPLRPAAHEALPARRAAWTASWASSMSPLPKASRPSTKCGRGSSRTRRRRRSLSTTSITSRGTTRTSGSKAKRDFPRPELLIDWMELEGPLYDSWPPSSHRRILIDSPAQGKDEEAYAREVLANFMTRAYRRPLREGEVEAKLELFREARGESPVVRRGDQGSAGRRPLVAAFSVSRRSRRRKCRATTSAPLSDFELASRLSYFLWSSMPDDELSRLAEQGKLADRRIARRPGRSPAGRPAQRRSS